MPLTLRPIRESDIGAYDRIVTSAFIEGGIMPLFYPNGITPEITAHSRRQDLKILRNKPHARIMVAIDTELRPEPGDYVDTENQDSIDGKVTVEDRDGNEEGRIVGIAYWKFYDKDRTDEEMKAEEEQDRESGFPPGADEKAMGAFFGVMSKCKKEELGNRAHVLLNILATDPKHHRRGIGAMQLKWGLDQADRLGLPSYLEASRVGKPLYARWGYEEIRPMPFDTRDFGMKENRVHTIMLRPRQNQTSGA